MPNIDDQLSKKKEFKKKTYRAYLSLDETLDDVSSIINSESQTKESVDNIEDQINLEIIPLKYDNKPTSIDQIIDNTTHMTDLPKNTTLSESKNETLQASKMKNKLINEANCTNNQNTLLKKIKRNGPTRPWREEGLITAHTMIATDTVDSHEIYNHGYNQLNKYEEQTNKSGEINNEQKSLIIKHSPTQTQHERDTNGTQNNTEVLNDKDKNFISKKNFNLNAQVPPILSDEVNPTPNMVSSRKIDLKAPQEPDKDSTITRQESRQRPDNRNRPHKAEPDNNPTTYSTSINFNSNLIHGPDKDSTITRQESRQRPDKNPDKDFSNIHDLMQRVIFLPDNPKKVFFYICNNLINDASECLVTTYKILIEMTQVSEGSIRSVLKEQLRTKYNLISIQSDSGGPQAKIKIYVDNDTLRTYLKIQNSDESRQRPDNRPDNRPDKNSPSKLVSNNILTNYTGESDHNISTNHNAWFKDLDFSRLPIIRPMMINAAIRRLVEEKLDRDDVQFFIFKFKNWLTTQQRVQNPVAIFCEKLKEWCTEGDTDVLYALSDEEIEAEKYFAEETEKRRSQIELINKAKEFEKSQKLDEEFESWYNNASDEELLSLQAPTSLLKFKSEIYKKTVRGIYAENYKNEEF